MRTRTSVTLTGTWAGCGFAAVVLTYLVALTVMMTEGLPFPPREPFTTTFHVIMMLAVLIMVPLWGAIHLAVPPHRRIYTLISLMFIVMLAVVVCVNRFVALTVVRQSPGLGRTAGLEWFQPYGWPSLTFALEILGWGVFFSLACLALAPAFRTNRLERGIAVTVTVTGVISLGGAVGLLVNSTAIMGVVAPLAWGLGPLVAAVLIMIWLRTGRTNPADDPRARAIALLPIGPDPDRRKPL